MSPGLVIAGEPSGFRSAGRSIFRRSPFASSFVPFPCFRWAPKIPFPAGAPEKPPLAAGPGPFGAAAVVVGAGAVVVVVSPPPRGAGAAAARGGRGLGGVVFVGVERVRAAGVAEVRGAVAVVVGEVRAGGQDLVGRGVHLEAVDGDRGRGARRDDRERGAEGDRE